MCCLNKHDGVYDPGCVIHLLEPGTDDCESPAQPVDLLEWGPSIRSEPERVCDGSEKCAARQRVPATRVCSLWGQVSLPHRLDGSTPPRCGCQWQRRAHLPDFSALVKPHSAACCRFCTLSIRQGRAGEDAHGSIATEWVWARDSVCALQSCLHKAIKNELWTELTEINSV